MLARVYMRFNRIETSADRKPISEIVNALNPKPDEYWVYGERDIFNGRPRGRTHECDGFSYNIKPVASVWQDEYVDVPFVKSEVDKVLIRAMQAKAAIDAALGSYEATLVIAADADRCYNPEIILTKDVIAGLAHFKADFWLDMYCLGVDDNGLDEIEASENEK